jgi:hypothetical protein
MSDQNTRNPESVQHRFNFSRPVWVNRVTFTESARLPLLIQLQTYRCVAISDALGHKRKCAASYWSLSIPLTLLVLADKVIEMQKRIC